MNISLNWLSAMLGRPLDPADVAHRLAMLGAGVEAIEPLHQDLGDIVVGLVEAVRPHPNAERLSLCQVNTGQGTVEVVCGARNVAAGKKYPYAREGTTLPGGLTLTARKIRGVLSRGMLCSAHELGLGTDQEGILELATNTAPGAPLTDALPVADTRLALEITANRGDLLGHRGVARELGAVYGVPVKLPPFPEAAPDGPPPRRAERRGTVDGLEVSIEDVAGCPRYIAAVIRGVRVAASPAWLEARLRSVGARSINNVVDATNYLLYELNQPLHAFDLARLRGGRIVVRRAQPGELITTLDGESRSLAAQMTMICDAEGPQAVAGVMGGRESEVAEETTDVVLECAYFDPKRVRHTRKALRLDTDASYRFERGTDIQAMADVVRRAVTLIRTVAGGEQREAPVDVYPEPVRPQAVFLRPERVERLLGVAMAREEIERHLISVGFVVAPKDGRLHVQVPGWRPDVTREVDLIEEVARLRGYDSFPVESRPYRGGTVPDDPVEPLKGRIRRVLTAWGLHESRTMPLVPAVADDPELVVLSNPVSGEYAALRPQLLASLERGLTYNWSVRERDIRLFEVGARFQRTPAGPAERLTVAAVVTGAREPQHWSRGARAADWDLWDVKAMFEETVRLCGPQGHTVAEGGGWVLVDDTGARRGRAGALAVEGPRWAAPAFGFELDVEVRPAGDRRFVPVPAMPPAERDLALLLPEGTAAQQVEEVVREAAGPLLERLAVFDEYRAQELAGRSVAWRLVFRAPERTLRDEEVEEIVARILARLREQLRVERREA